MSSGYLTSIPAHWTKATIGDTGSCVNGVAFKETDWHESGLPIIRIQNLTDKTKPYNFTERTVRADSRIDNGDILVSWSATLDAYRWNRGPAVLNQHIFKVLPNRDRVNDQFLFYLLKEAIAEMSMSAHAHGSTMKHINRGPFLAHEVHLPPLDEQRQIVAGIETQFARLDDAVAALQRARTRLKRYRASVLKAACEGRLVPTEAELARQEGRSYEPASVLLERIWAERQAAPGKQRGKTKVFPALDTSQLPELPEGWAWTTVAELNPSDRTCAYGVLQPGPNVDRGVPFVRVGDISDGHIELSSLKQIEPSVAAQYPRTTLRGGEVLITLVGTIGRTAVVPNSLARAKVARAVGVIPLVESVHSRWVEIWFRNPTKVREMVGKSHEVARKTLNLEDVREALVAMPPLEEQQLHPYRSRASDIDQ